MQRYRPRHLRLRTTCRNAGRDLDGANETPVARSDAEVLETALDYWATMLSATTCLLQLAREKQAKPDGAQRLILRGRFAVAMRQGGEAMRQFRSIVAAMDEPLRERLWLTIAGSGNPAPRQRYETALSVVRHAWKNEIAPR